MLLLSWSSWDVDADSLVPSDLLTSPKQPELSTGPSAAAEYCFLAWNERIWLRPLVDQLHRGILVALSFPYRYPEDQGE